MHPKTSLQCEPEKSKWRQLEDHFSSALLIWRRMQMQTHTHACIRETFNNSRQNTAHGTNIDNLNMFCSILHELHHIPSLLVKNPKVYWEPLVPAWFTNWITVSVLPHCRRVNLLLSAGIQGILACWDKSVNQITVCNNPSFPLIQVQCIIFLDPLKQKIYHLLWYYYLSVLYSNMVYSLLNTLTGNQWLLRLS